MKTATGSDKFRLCMAFEDNALHQTAHTQTWINILHMATSLDSQLYLLHTPQNNPRSYLARQIDPHAVR